MDKEFADIKHSKKKVRKTEREWSTGLFLLRTAQMGLSMEDLDRITFGMVLDMFTEMSNDTFEYSTLASQEDMDNF